MAPAPLTIRRKGMAIDKNYFDSVRKAQAEGDPLAGYIKGVKGIVHVNTIDTFNGAPVVLTLKGDPVDKNTDVDDITIFLWTQFELDYFRRANKTILAEGILAPYTKETIEAISVNEVSDEELEIALKKKFFAVRSLLNKFTSPAPVVRLLHLAQDMNKPVGTIAAIQNRLSELQKIDEG